MSKKECKVNAYKVSFDKEQFKISLGFLPENKDDANVDNVASVCMTPESAKGFALGLFEYLLKYQKEHKVKLFDFEEIEEDEDDEDGSKQASAL